MEEYKNQNEKEIQQLEKESTIQKKVKLDENIADKEKNQQNIQENNQNKNQNNENKQQNQEKKQQSLMPKKLNYKKIRAHANPLDQTMYPFPLNPDYVDWSIHYPKYFVNSEKQVSNMEIFCNTQQYPIQYEQIVSEKLNGRERNVDFVDVGCGFGGLLFNLGKEFPDKLSMGLEIRGKLVDYIGEKIRAFRVEQDQCHNICVLRTNAMRHFLQYYRKNSVEKLFFGFPDPHFKAKNFRRRIINFGFLSEYAYALKKGGRLYAITDVPDLHAWHVEKISEHSQFRVLSEKELKDDKAYKLIFNSSEESKKVDRHNCSKYAIVAERI